MFTSFNRTIKGGWINFKQNISLSIAAVFIIFIVIFLSTILFFLKPVSDIVISDIKNKVDISVYFKEEVKPEDISSIKTALSKMPEVKEVKYLSKDEVLENFIERHKNDKLIMESLSEVGNNPFLASLNIKSWQASQYAAISDFLNKDPFKDLIDHIDYYQRKAVIDKIFSTIDFVEQTGIIFFLFFSLIAILVAFNTIKAAIDSSKEEIATMRLVGASNWFIRGPFLVQGIITGLFSTICAFFLSFMFSYFLSDKIKSIIPEADIYQLFLVNIGKLILMQLVIGVGLGIISSMTAIRKYLKI